MKKALEEILKKNREAIINRWIDRVLSTYSIDGAIFFKQQKDRFANPLGYSVKDGLAKIFDMLCAPEKIEELPGELSKLVKLRAVQDFKPSEAVAFLYDLKLIVLEVCGHKKIADQPASWLELGAKIDDLALQIFDLYLVYRERVYQIKVNEYKSGNNIAAAGQCPSGAAMRRNKQEKIELSVIRDC